MAVPNDVEQRAQQYRNLKKVDFQSWLGTGTQGIVFALEDPLQLRHFAVKFHQREIAYEREKHVYLRLQELDITDVHGHEVPQLLGYDDGLLAIEMTVVSPPFSLDFGGAYLDRPPDYSPEVWADWRAMKAEALKTNGQTYKQF